ARAWRLPAHRALRLQPSPLIPRRAGFAGRRETASARRQSQFELARPWQPSTERDPVGQLRRSHGVGEGQNYCGKAPETDDFFVRTTTRGDARATCEFVAQVVWRQAFVCEGSVDSCTRMADA